MNKMFIAKIGYAAYLAGFSGGVAVPSRSAPVRH